MHSHNSNFHKELISVTTGNSIFNGYYYGDYDVLGLCQKYGTIVAVLPVSSVNNSGMFAYVANDNSVVRGLHTEANASMGIRILFYKK